MFKELLFMDGLNFAGKTPGDEGGTKRPKTPKPGYNRQGYPVIMQGESDAAFRERSDKFFKERSKEEGRFDTPKVAKKNKRSRRPAGDWKKN